MLHNVLIVRRNNVISNDPKCDALIVCVTFCNVCRAFVETWSVHFY